MSMQEQLQHLFALGLEHHPDAVGRFIANIEGWSPYPQHGVAPVSAVVDALPPTCRTQAAALLADASVRGMDDDAIREEIRAAHRTVQTQRARVEAMATEAERRAEDEACGRMWG